MNPKKLSTTLHTQFNYLTQPVCPFKGYRLDSSLQLALVNVTKDDLNCYIHSYTISNFMLNERIRRYVKNIRITGPSCLINCIIHE